jgi:Transposase DDE domain group 1
VRLEKHEIHRRIKSDLRIEFAPQQISSYSGLELFKRYFRIIGLNTRIRRAFQGYDFRGDYGVVDCILTLITLYLVGGNRLRHLAYIGEDPLVKRLCELSSLPSDRTLSRWLKQFTNDSLQALVSLNSEIVFEKLRDMELGTITLDFDGTVLSCGNKVQWAFRGYNPQNRHAKSYFPLLCHVAQTGHFLQVKNRPGNIHDAKCGALSVIKDCVTQVREQLSGVRIEVRMDAAFFQEEILDYLAKENIQFAVKVPMWKWLKLKEIINERSNWHHVDAKLSWFKKIVDIEQWDQQVEMTFFREKISEKPPKNYQLDLFTPDDGTYEYSVICSNKKLNPASLLKFYNGRCSMEHHIAEIKGEFAFDSIPTQHYQGNSAYQQISTLAYNLVRNFQIDTDLTSERKRSVSRTNVLSFDSLKTLRFEWINVAGRLLTLAVGKTLRLNECPVRQEIYTNISDALDELRTA